MTTAMQHNKCSALQAAMGKEEEPPFPACDARSRASYYFRAAQDALDFLIDLLSIGQPAVTQASPAACQRLECVLCMSGRSRGDCLRAAALPTARAGSTRLVRVCWVGMSVSSAIAV